VRLEVDATWERGLIGVTVDPGYPDAPYVYACYVAPHPAPHHVVSRLTLSHDRIDPSSEQILLEGDDQSKLGGTVPAGHQGGALHFGADGMLYAAIGEQTAGTPAQDLHSLLGKILRIKPDGSIPGDNPFAASTTGKYRAIWAIGLRNPFTFAIQPGTGRLFANDVGQNAWEEINEITRGGNYGWPAHEGSTDDPAPSRRFTPTRRHRSPAPTSPHLASLGQRPTRVAISLWTSFMAGSRHSNLRRLGSPSRPSRPPCTARSTCDSRPMGASTS
jgi:glucose/arabinose dehydrogenase